MMGHTPNIDPIGKEGMLFADHHAQPSCTAGRAAFITGVGQSHEISLNFKR
jgi:arylsulfatase A-like enzyme